MKHLHFILLLFIIQQVTGQGIQNIYRPGAALPKSTGGLIFYSLPRTVLSIDVSVTRVQYLGGPYAAFAAEMLGIKNPVSDDKFEWQIDSIRLNSFLEPDPEALFAIQVDKGFDVNRLLKFSQAGLIFDLSSPLNGWQTQLASEQEKAPAKQLTEYTLQGFISESFDTLYKTILKDTVFVKIPVLKPKTAPKTLYEKAKEASDIIFKIRQRRFELLMAEDEAFAEMNVLKFALNELQLIENAYLELFTGRITGTPYNFRFYYTPLRENRDLQFELFRFSNSAGISQKPLASHTPVYLSIEREARTKNLSEWLVNIPVATSGQLLYRIPDAAQVHIIFKGESIVSKKMLLNQFGTLVPHSIK